MRQNPNRFIKCLSSLHCGDNTNNTGLFAETVGKTAALARGKLSWFLKSSSPLVTPLHFFKDVLDRYNNSGSARCQSLCELLLNTRVRNTEKCCTFLRLPPLFFYAPGSHNRASAPSAGRYRTTAQFPCVGVGLTHLSRQNQRESIFRVR